jgi:hypothetical protein
MVTVGSLGNWPEIQPGPPQRPDRTTRISLSLGNLTGPRRWRSPRPGAGRALRPLHRLGPGRGRRHSHGPGTVAAVGGLGLQLRSPSGDAWPSGSVDLDSLGSESELSPPTQSQRRPNGHRRSESDSRRRTSGRRPAAAARVTHMPHRPGHRAAVIPARRRVRPRRVSPPAFESSRPGPPAELGPGTESRLSPVNYGLKFA